MSPMPRAMYWPWKLNAPVVVKDSVLVGDYEGYVHWLDKNDGQLQARKRVGNAAIRANTLVDEDIAYVSNLDGDLAALRIRQ